MFQGVQETLPGPPCMRHSYKQRLSGAWQLHGQHVLQRGHMWVASYDLRALRPCVTSHCTGLWPFDGAHI